MTGLCLCFLRWKPELYIKGGDYASASLRSASAVEAYGGRTIVIPRAIRFQYHGNVRAGSKPSPFTQCRRKPPPMHMDWFCSIAMAHWSAMPASILRRSSSCRE